MALTQADVDAGNSRGIDEEITRLWAALVHIQGTANVPTEEKLREDVLGIISTILSEEYADDYADEDWFDGPGFVIHFERDTSHHWHTYTLYAQATKGRFWLKDIADVD